MSGSISRKEAEKYAAIWGFDAYGINSPGAQFVNLFCSIARPKPGQTLIDVGAGAGAASKILKARGLDVAAFDLTDEGFDRSCGIHLHTGSVWHGLPGFYDFAYCCDMMEHLPTAFTALAIDKMLSHARAVFLSISFNPDDFGVMIGQPLHLTVQPFTWWRDMLRELGTLEEARDLMGDGVFYVRRP